MRAGEELVFDYAACASDEAEWRDSVCLCGAAACRGAYLLFGGAAELQQVRERPMIRFESLGERVALIWSDSSASERW